MDKKFNIRIDSKLLKKIKSAASKVSLSASAYIRLIIIEKLNKKEN